MMRTLRDKKTMHVVLWILIFAFVVGFVFIAVGTKYQSFNQRDPNLAAQVGNEKITLDQVNQIYEPALNRLYSASGQNPSQEEINQLRQGILDQLVDTSILNQTAQKLHVTVSTEEVASVIQRQPYFMGSDGKFDKNRYFQILQANQLTPEIYEQGERQDILTQKISSLLNDTVLYSPQDVRHYADLLNRSLKANYVVLELKKYEQNVHPDQDALKSYYESNKTQFDHPERAKSRHILLTLPAGATPAQEEAVSQTLGKYRQEILSGKTTFAKIAKEYSQDPGSKNQGGELGWATRGTMVKEFEDQIFDKLKKGQISEPFKTQFGYHIVQLEDYEKAYHSTFREVQDQVLKKYRAEQGLQQVTALAQQLALKLQQKESLTKVAAELKLKVDTTAWFTRKAGIPGIQDSKDLTQSLATLYVDQWKGPLPIGDNHYFFQITQTQPHSLTDAEFNELQPTAEAQLTQARQDEWEKAFLESQKKKLKVKTYLEDAESPNQ
ncbi:MAG: SurA N-terminal domain-containing protein [bacterium]